MVKLFFFSRSLSSVGNDLEGKGFREVTCRELLVTEAALERAKKVLAPLTAWVVEGTRTTPVIGEGVVFGKEQPRQTHEECYDNQVHHV